MSTMRPSKGWSEPGGLVRKEETPISIACIGQGVRHRILGARINLCRSEEEAAWPGKY